MLTNKCSIVKRIYAFLIDLCFIIITGLIFEYIGCIPFFNSVLHFNQKSDTLIVEQVKTNLYYFVNENYEIIVSGENDDEEIITAYKDKYTLIDLKNLVYSSNDYGSEFYIKGLNEFYNLFDNQKLISLKNESNLFNENNFKNEVSEEQRIEFCDNVYKEVTNDINLYKDGLIANLMMEISSLRILIFAISYLVPVIVFLCIIPMFNKKRASLGQQFLKLAVTDKYYVYAGRIFILLRVLAIYIFEFIFGFFTFGILPIASFILMIVLKNGQCLHDALSFTQVIDTKNFTPFENITEYKEFITKEKQTRDESLRKPYE